MWDSRGGGGGGGRYPSRREFLKQPSHQKVDAACLPGRTPDLNNIGGQSFLLEPEFMITPIVVIDDLDCVRDDRLIAPRPSPNSQRGEEQPMGKVVVDPTRHAK